MNKEIEFKYKAQVSIDEFKTFCNTTFKPLKELTISATDTFFSIPDDKTSFFRHRVASDANELTFKRKLNKTNNFIRTEFNFLLPASTTLNKIRDFTKEFGYSVESSINKYNIIFEFEWFVMSYYICYDKDMRELGRFIEIEAREDVQWSSESNAMLELGIIERACNPLGLNSKERLSESLFEMYGGK